MELTRNEFACKRSFPAKRIYPPESTPGHLRRWGGLCAHTRKNLPACRTSFFTCETSSPVCKTSFPACKTSFPACKSSSPLCETSFPAYETSFPVCETESSILQNWVAHFAKPIFIENSTQPFFTNFQG